LAVFLFFGSLKWALFELTGASVGFLISLLKKSDAGFLAYGLLKIESCLEMSMIPFWKENDFNRLIPSGLEPESSVLPQIKSILLLHQRLLISSTMQFLEDFDQI
jgi:hypothetical protein